MDFTVILSGNGEPQLPGRHWLPLQIEDGYWFFVRQKQQLIGAKYIKICLEICLWGPLEISALFVFDLDHMT